MWKIKIYITFTVTVDKKVTKIDKNGEVTKKYILYITIY